MHSFGPTPALRGAELAVEAGEILAVMGPSGSGKSTLLHCLAGILVPDAGEVWFEGRRVDTLGEPERSALRRDRFGFVFQFGQLVPELTAEENVALPLLLDGVRRAEALARPGRWFGRLGLGGLERPPFRRAVRRSGAARRARPRRWSAEPAVVFADEPTGSLDSLAGEQVMELLVAAARDAGHHHRARHPRAAGRGVRRPRGHRPRRQGARAGRRGCVVVTGNVRRMQRQGARAGRRGCVVVTGNVRRMQRQGACAGRRAGAIVTGKVRTGRGAVPS